MHVNAMTEESDQRTAGRTERPQRDFLRNLALQNALRKRAAGVPSYKVPEAAALMSISQEYLYRLIQADGFPAVRMGRGGKPRYVIPAKAVEVILDVASRAGSCVDMADLAADWHNLIGGGAA